VRSRARRARRVENRQRAGAELGVGGRERGSLERDAVVEIRAVLAGAQREDDWQQQPANLQFLRSRDPVVLSLVGASRRPRAEAGQHRALAVLERFAGEGAAPRRGARERPALGERAALLEGLARARMPGGAKGAVVGLDQPARVEQRQIHLELARVEQRAGGGGAARRQRVAGEQPPREAERGEVREHVAQQPEIGRRGDRGGQRDLAHHLQHAARVVHRVEAAVARGQRLLERVASGQHALTLAEQVRDLVAQRLPRGLREEREARAGHSGRRLAQRRDAACDRIARVAGGGEQVVGETHRADPTR
jgi:hypothetical protein